MIKKGIIKAYHVRTSYNIDHHYSLHILNNLKKGYCTGM